MSPSYLEAVRGLHELHRLTVAGLLDSPEADAVRDAADATWEALTEEEKQRLGGLSEDLYSITDPPRTAVKDLNPQAKARLAEVDQARQNGEGEKALELLRKWGTSLEPSAISVLRGAIWQEVGDLATAAIFYNHARGPGPDIGNLLPPYFDRDEKPGVL